MDFLNDLDFCLTGTTKIVTGMGLLLGIMISYQHPGQYGSWQVGRTVALLNPRVSSQNGIIGAKPVAESLQFPGRDASQ